MTRRATEVEASDSSVVSVGPRWDSNDVKQFSKFFFFIKTGRRSLLLSTVVDVRIETGELH